MPVQDALVWRVTDELLYTRRVTDATYAEALAVLGEQPRGAAIALRDTPSRDNAFGHSRRAKATRLLPEMVAMYWRPSIS